MLLLSKGMVDEVMGDMDRKHDAGFNDDGHDSWR
jgi:hypothetical protein